MTLSKHLHLDAAIGVAPGQMTEEFGIQLEAPDDSLCLVVAVPGEQHIYVLDGAAREGLVKLLTGGIVIANGMPGGHA